MHWYALSKATGVATLCAGEHDARRESKSYDRLYPRAAPHVAVRLVPVLDTASSDAVGRDVALALDWARANAGEHADTIIEALAAYDPECGGRTAQAPERRAVTDEDVRRARKAYLSSHCELCDEGCTEHSAHLRAALESLAGVPAAQPADEIADLTKRLAAAQRPFDPDVAEVIRKGWDTLFDDAQPAPDAAREPADAQLADTQRAIIEAAEARWYARAKVEGEANDEAPELRQTVLILRNVLARAMEWNWLDDDARPSDTALLCDAALASVDAMLAAAPPNGETE